MHAEGHEIGNHSWSHADFTKLTPAEVDSQLRMTQAAIAKAGVPTPQVFRPPYGAVNDMVKGHARMTIVRWDIDPADWEVMDAAKIHESILGQAKPGGIVLMHDIYPTTADALDSSILDLKARGYQFVTVSQLMNLDPGDQGQYFGLPR
jgi:peptidoglycan/xylan/chitin deacetylase (PgdA/CDA1 family)